MYCIDCFRDSETKSCFEVIDIGSVTRRREDIKVEKVDDKDRKVRIAILENLLKNKVTCTDVHSDLSSRSN